MSSQFGQIDLNQAGILGWNRQLGMAEHTHAGEALVTILMRAT